MLHHKFFTREEVITSFTIVSTGRWVTLSLSVCFLNSNSATSAMLTIHEWGDQSPPLDKDAMFDIMIWSHNQSNTTKVQIPEETKIILPKIQINKGKLSYISQLIAWRIWRRYWNRQACTLRIFIFERWYRYKMVGQCSFIFFTFLTESCNYRFQLQPNYKGFRCLSPNQRRSAVPGVSPGRGLLIPHGYLFTPG